MKQLNIYEASTKNLDDILYIQKLSTQSIISKANLINDLKNKNCKYYLAYLDNTLVAYIGTSYILDTLDILSLMVIPTYRNKGIASKLLSTVNEFCINNNINTILLEVRKSNNIAISLYEKFGFKKISERKNYYRDEDALIYILNL